MSEILTVRQHEGQKLGMFTQTLDRPYLNAWLRRTGRQFPVSGRLSQTAAGESGSVEEWRTRLKVLVEGNEMPSLDFLTRSDGLLARPAKVPPTGNSWGDVVVEIHTPRPRIIPAADRRPKSAEMFFLKFLNNFINNLRVALSRSLRVASNAPFRLHFYDLSFQNRLNPRLFEVFGSSRNCWCARLLAYHF